MPGGTTPALGNEQFDQLVYAPSVTYPTLATNASGNNTFSIPGVQALDFIGWNMQNPPAHLVLDNAYVSAPGVLTLTWSSDVTGISTATVAVMFSIVRGTNAASGTSAFPNGIY
jgi:hypothetical protein